MKKFLKIFFIELFYWNFFYFGFRGAEYGNHIQNYLGLIWDNYQNCPIMGN